MELDDEHLTSIDEHLLLPLIDIKTNGSDVDVELKPTDDGASNTVLLDENIKDEPSTEPATAQEDPLNIIHKLEMKSDIPENGVEFQGQYNECDFFKTEAVEVESPEVEQKSRRNKRMRISVGEIKGRNGYIWSKNKSDAIKTKDDGDCFKSISPRGKGPARLVANILEAWHLLLDDPILHNILKHTNEEIKKRKGKNSTTSYQRSCDLQELRAWIGLNYLCGVFAVNGGNLEELWTPELGNGIFRATMSLKRFEFLSDCMRFGEKAKKSYKNNPVHIELQDVYEVWEKFIINCRSYYAPSGNCVLEEYIIDMTSTDCPKKFNVSIPTNNYERQGIRLISLHDAKTLYMCNAIIGCSAEPIKEEVLALVCDIKGTFRNIILTQRYTTFEMAQNLVQSQLSLVGNLPLNAMEIPREFNIKSKQIPSKIYSGENTLILTDDDNKILLSSALPYEIDAVKLYTGTEKSGQRFYDAATSYTTTSTLGHNASSKSRWSLRFFHSLLDFACLNAWLLFRLSEQGKESIQQRDFQRQLGLFLTQQHLKRRLQKNSKIPFQLKLLICEILGEPIEDLLSEAVSAAAQANSAGEIPLDNAKIPSHIQLLSKTTPKRGRCRSCPSKNNIKTRWQCQQCARSLCLTHLIMRCSDCTGLSKNTNEEKDVDFK